jgi:hypothetical protein
MSASDMSPSRSQEALVGCVLQQAGQQHRGRAGCLGGVLRKGMFVAACAVCPVSVCVCRSWAVKCNVVHYSWGALMINQYQGQESQLGGLTVLSYFGECSLLLSCTECGLNRPSSSTCLACLDLAVSVHWSIQGPVGSHVQLSYHICLGFALYSLYMSRPDDHHHKPPSLTPHLISARLSVSLPQ